MRKSFLAGLLDSALRARMYKKLKEIFGFNYFRHRQKPAIVAALLGQDCFILMPTGLMTDTLTELFKNIFENTSHILLVFSHYPIVRVVR